MKNMLIITLVLITLSVHAQSEKSNKAVADKQQCEKLINQYGDAINSSGVCQDLAVFTKDGVLMASGAPTATGHDQLKGTCALMYESHLTILL